MANAERGTRRSKYIDIRYHVVRDAVTTGLIELRSCPTEEMIADMLTKNLGKIKFAKFSNAMRGSYRKWEGVELVDSEASDESDTE